MLNMERKIETLRVARARSVLRVHPETIQRLKGGKVPKQDVLAVAKTAGMLAAKKTPELIPYCHPLPLDGVEIELTVGEDHIAVEATVRTIGKTGVEMEALTAVTVTALNLYDMLKPIDKEMVIAETKLLVKHGGKSDFICKVPENFKAAVIVTSDSTAQGKRQDNSGKILKDKLTEFGIKEIDYCILPDDRAPIVHQLLHYCELKYDLILTTGGTGMGPRDVTVEATSEVIEREMPAVMQAIRSFGQARTPYSMLSRGLAGVRNKTVILNLPGSSRGAAESMDAVFPALFHVYPMLRGGGH